MNAVANPKAFDWFRKHWLGKERVFLKENRDGTVDEHCWYPSHTNEQGKIVMKCRIDRGYPA